MSSNKAMGRTAGMQDVGMLHVAHAAADAADSVKSDNDHQARLGV